MRKNLAAYSACQVFLNYPFDRPFAVLSEAMSFAVVAGGLLPVCAYDLTIPDKPRLDSLVEAIRNCRYSAHDLSRSRGEGPSNFARMNMPVEMGMALFHALQTQRSEHRLCFSSRQHMITRFSLRIWRDSTRKSIMANLCVCLPRCTTGYAPSSQQRYLILSQRFKSSRSSANSKRELRESKVAANVVAPRTRRLGRLCTKSAARSVGGTGEEAEWPRRSSLSYPLR
jgi:hypothetical protein